MTAILGMMGLFLVVWVVCAILNWIGGGKLSDLGDYDDGHSLL